VTTYTGFQVPHFDLKQATYLSIALRGAGGALFVLGSGIGAYLLLIHQAIFTPILYDFYNYEADKREFNPSSLSSHRTWHCLGRCSFILA